MANNTKQMKWVGWAMTVLGVLPFLPSAFLKISQAPMVMDNWPKSGFPISTVVPIGIAEILCIVLYLVPQTSILGAALTTAYLGGAVASHIQQSQSFLIPIVCGVLIWGGLTLREPRLRAIFPLRCKSKSPA